jgi:DNA-binding XRE family transcriptional regulator
MTVQMVKIEDQELVILTRRAFEELMEKAGVLPPLPPPDGRGTMDARAAIDASIAREVVCRRIVAGLTQTELARRSGVRLETVCRLEAGKHVPRQETVIRLDRALRAAEKGQK